MQLGKMYLVKEGFWYLFATKEPTKCHFPSAAWERDTAYAYAKMLSERYNCNISVVEENTCFVLLEVDDNHFKLLDSNGNVGWIYCSDFSKCFEFVNNATW